MSRAKGYTTTPLSFNRRAVIASASVTRDKSSIHAMTQVDISEPRRRMRDYFEATGEKISLTAYVVHCLGATIVEHPQLNCFRSGRKRVTLQDATVSVLVERKYEGEQVPEPVVIRGTSEKNVLEIQREIRKAQSKQGDKLGSLSAMTLIRMIPGFLLRTFIRMADRNKRMGVRYGKLAVTAIGMFARDAVWFVPHGTATVLVTVGGIEQKVIPVGETFETREHLCLTLSFDHDLVDGAPAARFVKDFAERVRSGEGIG
jgi:pyruvate/2-oxoglutarate dehydrogenase complex dihydrolipoamide acyltransferase (E2) component